jgi:hypothetical protein
MLKSIVVCIDTLENVFYTGHPLYRGPYAMNKGEFKVGDKIYVSPTTHEWVKDRKVKCHG